MKKYTVLFTLLSLSAVGYISCSHKISKKPTTFAGAQPAAEPMTVSISLLNIKTDKPVVAKNPQATTPHVQPPVKPLDLMAHAGTAAAHGVVGQPVQTVSAAASAPKEFVFRQAEYTTAEFQYLLNDTKIRVLRALTESQATAAATEAQAAIDAANKAAQVALQMAQAQFNKNCIAQIQAMKYPFALKQQILGLIPECLPQNTSEQEASSKMILFWLQANWLIAAHSKFDVRSPSE